MAVPKVRIENIEFHSEDHQPFQYERKQRTKEFAAIRFVCGRLLGIAQYLLKLCRERTHIRTHRIASFQYAKLCAVDVLSCRSLPHFSFLFVFPFVFCACFRMNQCCYEAIINMSMWFVTLKLHSDSCMLSHSIWNNKNLFVPKKIKIVPQKEKNKKEKNSLALNVKI